VRLAVATACLMLAVLSYGDPAVGTTSKQWGIVITPCAWCGTTNKIEVHHVCPQHIRPDLAHDTNNMVCLCRVGGKGCHYYIGHHGKEWRYVFTNVMEAIKVCHPACTNKPTP